MKKRVIAMLGAMSLQVILPVTAKEASIEIVEVEGRQLNLIGEAISASEGQVNQQEMQLRPLLRTGDILEFVPGMVVTQHSGTGKANQYFLRGFNLDHGTDFSTVVDGMPVNMRTHGHGQGYTDLNFIIPETVAKLSYQKGGYHADSGDFSGAGSAKMFTATELNAGEAEVTIGENNYLRLLAMSSVKLTEGNLLAAIEYNKNDGPWTDINENLNKKNALLKYSQSLAQGLLSINFMAYDNRWNSADQIPTRAFEQGLITPLGSLDTSLGGQSSRYSLSANWQNEQWSVATYAIQYDMQLWSNFTYYLDNENNGDQFEQVDKRNMFGGQIHYLSNDKWAAFEVTNKIGAEIRYDAINEVALYQTQNRQHLGVVRSDAVDELSSAIFWENKIHWTDNLRTVLGARADYYDFEVKDLAGINVNGINLSANNGKQNDSILSLKGSLIYTFEANWEAYFSAGQGFHSNDARGTTINVDPNDGSAVDKVDPLINTLGYEVGLRGFISEKLNTSIALWSLDLDSELIFVGDAGNTEASRGSKRQGIEVTAYYHFTPEFNADFEYAYTDAEFTDNDIAGNNIPGAIQQVLQAGLNANFDNGLFGSLRLRHFGKRPLIEDGSITSDNSTIINLRAGYQADRWTIKVDILNLTDSNDHDIDYFYGSKLANEDNGVEDIHYHIFEPRTLRLSVAYQF